jgi:hypothetical protein
MFHSAIQREAKVCLKSVIRGRGKSPVLVMPATSRSKTDSVGPVPKGRPSYMKRPVASSSISLRSTEGWKESNESMQWLL